MRTVASIGEAPAPLLPGGDPVSVPVTVRNAGDIVQAYSIEVLGIPQRFATVEPPTLSLYPGTSGTAVISLVAPRISDVRAGDFPMGVRVTPTGSTDEPVTQETSVRVLPFLSTTAELIPRTTRGRRGATHDLAVDNRGNVAMKCIISGADPNGSLRFEERPQILEIGPGEARFATVAVKPVQGFWRGPARTHAFLVDVTPEDAAPVTLDGTHLQEPRLPPWLFKALAALLALLVALLALWLLLLRPAIDSMAKDAVAQDVAAAQDAASQAKQAAQSADQSKQGAQDAESGAKGSQADVADTRDKVDKVLGDNPIGVPTSRRLLVSVAKGSTATETFTVADNRSLGVTDVVFENPQGDSGTLELTVNGETRLTLALENFRAMDYHFVTPIEVASGQEVGLKVACREPGTPPGVDPAPKRCVVSAYVGGELTKA